MACQEAGEHRSHDLLSPSASTHGMDEPCLASQTTIVSYTGGDVNAPRSGARAIPFGANGGANSRMTLSSPITPPLVLDRKAGTLGKGCRLGGLQIGVDYREVSDYCNVAPLSPIAEEGGATPTYVTTPVEPEATPVPPVLSLQNTHSHPPNRCGRHCAALAHCYGQGDLVTYVAGVSSRGCGLLGTFCDRCS